MARQELRGLILLMFALALTSARAQIRHDSHGLRLYVFDNGSITGRYGADLSDVSYLIVHPRGTLMWDTGMIPDSQMPTDGSALTQGSYTAAKTLKSQLAAAGYAPRDINYLAMSHAHPDHTGNANEFAAATWIVHEPERDWMFAEKPQGNIQPGTFDRLKDSSTIVLRNVEDYDVFGDGTVIIKSAPGHTPGHQVLFVKLPKTGPVLLVGDLYHSPEERGTGPASAAMVKMRLAREFNAGQSVASRAKIEAFVMQTKAQLWIEHDMAFNAKLKKAPAYFE